MVLFVKKYRTNFVYLSTIIKVVSYTRPPCLFKNKSVIKSIVIFSHGFENIGNVLSTLYGVYRFIFTRWYMSYESL